MRHGAHSRSVTPLPPIAVILPPDCSPCRVWRFGVACASVERTVEQSVRVGEGSAEPATGLSRWPIAVAIAGVALAVMGLAMVPPDATLGGDTRAVFFHGAVTWTGIIMATCAGLAGLGTLVLRWDAPARVWRLLTLATASWVLSLTLSFPVMRMTWGGVLWNEPKLLMSAEVVSTFLVAWAVSLLAGKPWVTAAAAVVAAALMAALLVATPGAFHPDNPIFRSGNARFIGSFLLIAAGLVLVAGGIVFWPRRVR